MHRICRENPPLWATANAARIEEAVTQHVALVKQLCAMITILINTMTYLRKENGMDARTESKIKGKVEG